MKGKKTKASKKPAKQPKSKKPTMSVTKDIWEDVVEARRREKNAEIEVLAKSEDLKSAKKNLDLCSERLGKLIDEAQTGQQRLPFKDAPAAGAQAQPATATDTEVWKSAKITELTPVLSKRALKSLADHGTPIVTMGDMAAHQAKHGDFWAKEIKGFGESGAEQYAKASEQYFKGHPQAATPAVKGKANGKGKVSLSDLRAAAEKAVMRGGFEVSSHNIDAMVAFKIDLPLNATITEMSDGLIPASWIDDFDELSSDAIRRVLMSADEQHPVDGAAASA